MNRKTTTFERATLYKEVWEEPVTVVARRYAISDVGLRKVCQKLDIPTPPLGYWAKKRAGQNVRPTPLPATRGATAITSLRDEPDPEAICRNEEAHEDEAVVRQRQLEARPENVIVVREDFLGWGTI